LVLPVGIKIAVLVVRWIKILVFGRLLEIGIVLDSKVGRLRIGELVGLVGHGLHHGNVLFELGGIGREWKDHRGEALGAGTE
jgi:hypothetical protein